MSVDRGGLPPKSRHVSLIPQNGCRLILACILSLLCVNIECPIGQVNALLRFNPRQQQKFQPSPDTVNADSILEITQLTSTTIPTYSAGDCFHIEFDPISAYILEDGTNYYEPFPYDDFETCDFTPSATCSKIHGYRVSITLLEDGSDLIGTFGKFKNPFSSQQLLLNKIRYYPSCLTDATESDATQFQNRFIRFQPGRIDAADVQFSTSEKYVGAQDSSNIATFVFSPLTTLSEIGGSVQISTPIWYGEDSNMLEYLYPFRDAECAVDQFERITLQGEASIFDERTFTETKSFEIHYERLAASVSNTDQITISCKYWKNPILPEISTGFFIQTKDAEGKTIDVTYEFSLDASTYDPYPLNPASITYQVSTETVQKDSALTVSFITPVFFEFTGCYFRFRFPDEIVVMEGKLIGYEVQDYLLTALGNTDSVPVAKDFDGAEKYVIMEGCRYNSDPSVPLEFVGIKFENLQNPYATRDTDLFRIDVWKNWDPSQLEDNGLSQQILSSTQSFIPASTFKSNIIENIQVTADNMMVQEKVNHQFAFTTTSILPSTSNAANADEVIKPAIHIMFPPTFEQDLDNQAADVVTISGAGITVTSGPSYEVDTSAKYNPLCQLDGHICFTIEFVTAADIPANTRITVQTSNMKNPESIEIAGDIVITTMMRYDTDPQYYPIDTSTQPSNFQATSGTLDPSLMIAVPDPINKDFSTNAKNQQYEIQFTSNHAVYSNGFIKLEIPDSFTMTSESSAVALFQVRDEAGNQYASIDKVSGEGGYVIGQVTVKLEADTIYFIRIGGLKNPRYLIDNDDLPDDEKQLFTVKTYASTALEPIDSDNLIDSGSGAGVLIDVLSPIESFSVEGYNTTNGVSTKYFFTWFTEIDSESDDYLEINLAPELEAVLPVSANRYSLVCTGINGVEELDNNRGCAVEVDSDNSSLLKVTLKKLTQQTGLFKISIENIRNAPSLRGSSAFGLIIQKTSKHQSVSSFQGPADVVSYNDFSSGLQGLGADNIEQTDKEYEAPATYRISFTPYSKVVDPDAKPLMIHLSYPSTISPLQANGCEVEAAKNADGTDIKTYDSADCAQTLGSRLFVIQNAIPYGHDAHVTIVIGFNNPVNNWGDIGFKIKTYEVIEDDDSSKQYLVDSLEGNELIPNLKCIFPCKECKHDQPNDVEAKGTRFCTECWSEHPSKYLYTHTDWNPTLLSGDSSCYSECPAGFTSNGDTQTHKCVPCSDKCAECLDDGNVGDKDKCTKCKPNWFFYAPDQTCMTSCGLGYYEINADTCDACSSPCLDCVDDNLNCIQCDAGGQWPALFTTTAISGGSTIERSTCRPECPTGYYMDRGVADNIKCKPCKSPCSTCEGSESACLSCDGTDDLYYVYDHSCYEECPDFTAPDMSVLECVDCPANCLKCGISEEPSCFECDPPFLLEDGICVVECQKAGNSPNLAKTQCVGEREFPPFGPIFSIFAIVSLFCGFIAKKLKRETKVIPFAIAMWGMIQWFAILMQIYLCSFYLEWKYMAFCGVAWIFLMCLNLANYLYIQSYVVATDAEKKVKLSQKKLKQLDAEQKKKDRRQKAYDKRVQAAREELGSPDRLKEQTQKKEAEQKEGGEIELENFYNTSSDEEYQYKDEYDLDNLSDPGSSKSKDADVENGSDSESQSDDGVDFEGGEIVLNPNTIEQQKIIVENGSYYQMKNIKDKGYIKWAEAFEETAKYIKIAAAVLNFKVYRLTYCFFFGRKQFLCLYQKKKYKKFMVTATLLSMFFVELMIIICDVVGVLNLKVGTQIWVTFADTFVLSCMMMVLQFVEIAKLDTIMRTQNTSGHRANKSAAACLSSSDDSGLSSDADSENDDYPDWRLMLKHVEGNASIFKKTELQLHLNDLEKKYDPKLRIAESCVDTAEDPWKDYFNTGTEKEQDPRLTRSFPTSPRFYKEFSGAFPELKPLDATSDNCGFEAKDPGPKGNATYSEMGTQAQPTEILSALARKGGDLLTPGLEKDDYLRKKTTKKKRGRKNKYYRQIDAEDDEEADQMSDGSDDDGLDGIKEEDDEDEDERRAKLAKIKAEKERLAREQAEREEIERKKKEAEEQARLEAERKKAEEEAERLRKLAEEEEKKRMAEQNAKEAADALKALQDKKANDKKSEQDNASDLSKAMVKSTALQNFGDRPDEQVIEAPPKIGSRRFNECDIIGNYDRDDKGNVMVGEPDENGKYFDKDGRETNSRGYLVNEKGDVINNYNGKKMFNKNDLDEKGEVPAPFNVEKHNFNPHEVRGHFDYDKNGNPIIKKDKSGEFTDKRGSRVSSRGYLIDKDGNVIDHCGRPKFDKSHVTSEGDLPKLFNYGGRRFDVTDTIGQLDKDANGQIIPLTDQQGKLTDNLGRPINSKGYLIDELGNVIDKDGRQIFEKKHLYEDEYPKILPFSKFNVKNVLGDFEMDPLGQPILEKQGEGDFKDRAGQKVNSKGYMVDREGNIVNKDKKIMFPKALLDNEQDIPKVFRTGLLKSDTASSLSRLMSEIGKNQPSEFDQEEQRIQEEIARNIKGQKRGNSGNTSVDSMMEDTPANYNYQNQRFDADMEGDGDEDMDQQDEDDDDDDYGSQYDQMGRTGFTNQQDGVQELAKKRRKKKKKKKKKKPVEFEDPSLREHLLAGAYGGVAKRKPKRQGVKYTTDMNAGLRDIATPASAFMRDPSKKMMTSFSGFQEVGHARDSSRGKRGQRIASSKGRSEVGSQIGSRIGGGRKQSRMGDSTAKLLDPQQREQQLKQQQMDEIAAKRAAKIAAKKKRLAGAKPGKISQDADFEKMFGKDIDEFLEDSEWDIESIDKMSQFSKNSKNTIRSAAQAGKLKGLEKLYLQRIETSMNRNNLNQAPNANVKAGGRPGKFRDQDSMNSPGIPQAKHAWETGSRVSKGQR